MRNSETPVVKDIQLALSLGDTRLWRNNVGEAWAGNGYETSSGGIVIPNPYRVNFGLCPGSGDLIGFESVVITEEMVGRRVAVFASLEVKRPKGGDRSRPGMPNKLQRDFIEHIQTAGGIAGVARSIPDAKKIIESF